MTEDAIDERELVELIFKRRGWDDPARIDKIVKMIQGVDELYLVDRLEQAIFDTRE